MKINNLGVSNTSLTAQQQVAPTASGGEQTSSLGAAATASAYTPSAELTKLVGLVQQQSAVRPDVVIAARQRLQQGDYNTSAAAAQTATAMLAALD
jgi:hypothetical protein